MTYLELATRAYRRRGVLRRPGVGLSASEKVDALAYLNVIIDEWQASKRYSYDYSFTLYTITPAHQPHTIGPGLTSPNWATVGAIPRPTRIKSASLVLNTSTPTTDLPLCIRDDAWWAALSVKGLTSSTPTDLYYSPDLTNGSVYLWPVPTYAYSVRLEAEVTLGQVSSLANTVTLPVAYTKALELTLCEEIPTDVPLTPMLMEIARKARAAVQSNNTSSPRIASADYGTGLGSKHGFNWQSGGPA